MKRCLRCNRVYSKSHFRYSRGKPIARCKPCEKLEKADYRRKTYIKRLEQRIDIRLAALKILGGQCVRCNNKDYRVLQIDHIYGGGYKELKAKTSDGICRSIIKNPEAAILKYQCLCANCNWIKRAELGEKRKSEFYIIA